MEKKQRVPRGEWYYYVDIHHGVEPTPMNRKDMREREDDSNFYCNNYFHYYKEAAQMAYKIKAILNGKNMIDVSKEDLEVKSSMSLADAGWRENDNACLSYIDGFMKGVMYIKSKIVK